jgi:hypothetical protein
MNNAALIYYPTKPLSLTRKRLFMFFVTLWVVFFNNCDNSSLLFFKSLTKSCLHSEGLIV